MAPPASAPATKALWTWNVSGSAGPVVQSYSSGKATKTGLEPSDLVNFAGVPLQYYGNPSTPMQAEQLLDFLRWGEDWVEQRANLLLCQTWIASPPARTILEAQNMGITPTSSGGYQVLGVDYDLEDAAYDFFFPRAQDEGWMAYMLRYRPLKSIAYDPLWPTALKQLAYVYPLLNEFFAVPWSWMVTDADFGLVRLVPSTNVQMLPLFAMELAFMGFAESVPGALWMQYTAGLTAADYSSRFSFMKRLVLSAAVVPALAVSQGQINYGIEGQRINIDGVMYETKYPKEGPYSGLINEFMRQRDELLDVARSLVSGPMFTTL